MSEHISRTWLKTSTMVAPVPYDLKNEIIGNVHSSHPRAIFRHTIRHFVGGYRHSSENIKYFVELFEAREFSEWHNPRSYSYQDWTGTLRYARRAFWQLIAMQKEKAAFGVLERTLAYLQLVIRDYRSCSHPQKPNEVKKAEIAFDAVIIFTFEQFRIDTRIGPLFNAQGLRFFLAHSSFASIEVQNRVFLIALQKFVNDITYTRTFSDPHIDQSKWVKMRVLFLALLETDKDCLSKECLSHLGKLLSLLNSLAFMHPDFSFTPLYDRKINDIKMREGIAGIEVLLNGISVWLCGKGKKFEITPWFSD